MDDRIFLRRNMDERIFAVKGRFLDGSGQQNHQLTLAVQLGQIVEAADVMLTDENLRHATTAAQCHHFLAANVIEFNVDFPHFNPFAGEQRFGVAAIRTGAGGVHGDVSHGKNPRGIKKVSGALDTWIAAF
jgi:hypothetical protein